ncbi:LysR family transcriptional regulator [Paraburkholderia guartelaensis]|uniref:LysR family transcriptional regulator n=1 Tax=Paraburkholderia guartelaensis TaxID=2546446 RepID=A0A4R5LCJ6_9BURK|nr:LysR family transcriptional regulator [Paraburkholderia guartelaensis]TDG06563.1 LysR family transcriptional regulator [Paraburkholderia guartelaensis]
MVDLNALVMFARVVEAGSFSAAARLLDVPVSTVSRRVAELERALGVRLLERSTRTLRLTELGREVFEHAARTAQLGAAIDQVVSSRLSDVSGVLRLSCPPSIAGTLLTPLVIGFQERYPNVRIQVLVTERFVDHIADGVDLVLRVGALRDSSLVARRLLAYRHRLVATPAYLRGCRPPEQPRDLLEHRLLAFSQWKPQSVWNFVHSNGRDKETLTFEPYFTINDFAGLAPALLTCGGIGELPPLVRPDLVREGKLVEVMPSWRLQTLNLSLVHLGNRHISKPCRLFKDFAIEVAPSLFPDLPE